jgi:hypothetical protein
VDEIIWGQIPVFSPVCSRQLAEKAALQYEQFRSEIFSGRRERGACGKLDSDLIHFITSR